MGKHLLNAVYCIFPSKSSVNKAPCKATGTVTYNTLLNERSLPPITFTLNDFFGNQDKVTCSSKSGILGLWKLLEADEELMGVPTYI